MKLDYSKVTPKMIRKALACKDVEALKDLIRAEGFEAEEGEAEKLFRHLKDQAVTLSADELENIAGGKKCMHHCEKDRHEPLIIG